MPDTRLKKKKKKKEKDSDRAITPAAEGVSAHVVPPGSPQAKQLYHLHAQLSLGQSCHRQSKFSRLCVQGCFFVSDSLWPFRLWPARLLCQGGGFSRQEYWSVSANTGCYTLLLLLSHFSRVQLYETAWTVACQATLSGGFSRQYGVCWLILVAIPL